METVEFTFTVSPRLGNAFQRLANELFGSPTCQNPNPFRPKQKKPTSLPSFSDATTVTSLFPFGSPRMLMKDRARARARKMTWISSHSDLQSSFSLVLHLVSVPLFISLYIIHTLSLSLSLCCCQLAVNCVRVSCRIEKTLADAGECGNFHALGLFPFKGPFQQHLFFMVTLSLAFCSTDFLIFFFEFSFSNFLFRILVLSPHHS